MKPVHVALAVSLVAVGLFSLSGRAMCGEEMPAVAVPGQPNEYCPEREVDWNLVFAPYFWAISIKGSSTLKGSTSQVDASFGDILDNLKCALVGHLELHKGNFFILSDTNVLITETDAGAEKSVFGPLGYVQVKGEIDATLKSTSLIQEFFAGWKMYECGLGGKRCDGLPRTLRVDGLLGLRYYYMDVDLDADAKLSIIVPQDRPVFVRKASVEVKDTEEWVDPVVGARMKYDLTDRLAFSLRGDIGGFGAGSDLSWGVTAVGRYQITPKWSFVGGYKVLDFDYEKGSTGYDMRIQGPVASLMYVTSF